MRLSKMLTLVLLLSLSVSACSVLSDNENPPSLEDKEPTLPHVEGVSPVTESSLVGSWQWIGAVGGIVGQTITPDSPGYSTQEFRFGADKTFSFYRAEMLELDGSYTLEREGETALLHYETESDQVMPGQEVRMSAGQDTLILVDLCIDCYRSLYSRRE